MEKYEIRILEVNGDCVAGHKPGDSYQMESFLTPSGICIHAFHALYPWLQVIRFRGKIPWEEENQITVACPDHKNQVVLRVVRIE